MSLKLQALLKQLLQWRLRTRPAKAGGFTLIELLVGLIIAVLVMIPLLGLAVNLISTDRREQAKATTEQDLQAAADFIARDLQQAIYIYDSVALTQNRDLNNPDRSGIRDQIPPFSGTNVNNCNSQETCIPVLAFWTRRVVEGGSPIVVNNSSPNCLTGNATLCDDTFVYSFVAYYLILAKPDPNGAAPANSVWSNAARIGRFEVSAGVTDSNDELVPVGQSAKPRDAGYGPFDLSLDGEDIRGKMNRWDGAVAIDADGNVIPNSIEAYGDNSMQILVDHIDATTFAINNNVPRIDCPAVDIELNNNRESQKSWIQSPYYGNPNPVPNPAPNPVAPAQFQTYSFYACINSEQNIARIFLRGNALSRLRPNDNTFYNESAAALFPTVSAEVQTEGRLFQ
ncbi:MAG: hormogonium polysaccharide secretion pseudopilin HpsC [Spirulinaceae cyanobacterium]